MPRGAGAVRRDRGGGLGRHDGWVLHRINTVLGRRMRARCLARDHTLRLVRRGRARFTPSLVHESLQLAPGATTGRRATTTAATTATTIAAKAAVKVQRLRMSLTGLRRGAMLPAGPRAATAITHRSV